MRECEGVAVQMAESKMKNSGKAVAAPARKEGVKGGRGERSRGEALFKGGGRFIDHPVQRKSNS